MGWVTWRQHRLAVGGMTAFLGAFAVYLWLTGVQMHDAYPAACGQVSSFACGGGFTGRYGPTAVLVSIFLQAVPALIGAFIGAPALARELETGTFRYVFTQGIGRWRWALGKLAPLAVVVVAEAAAFSVLFSWYDQPFVAVGYAIPFSARLFGLVGVAFTAWTLAAFAIGVVAGVLIRRVVPAIVATLAVDAGLALTTGLFLRGHYMTPLTTNQPDLPSGAWAVSQWYSKDGTFAFPARGSQLVDAVEQFCPRQADPSDPSASSPARCLAQHGYTLWTNYQPGSRFWPFQWIESGWLLALSVLLIAATVWLVRRRAT
jgi:hypothetical protein